MAATKTLLTLADYQQLPRDGTRHELDGGELITMTFPRLGHSRIQQRINHLLATYLQDNPLGEVLSEPGCLIRADPPTLRGPDVAFLLASRASSRGMADYIQGAPDIAVEVISPSDSASHLQKKVGEYLDAGSHAVWVVYPDTREVHVFGPTGAVRVLKGADTLEIPDLLPGLSIPLAAIFD